MRALTTLSLVPVALGVVLALASCSDSEPRSALANRPNDWAEFPVGEVIDELVGTSSEVPDLVDQLVTQCLGNRGIGPTLIAEYETRPPAEPSPTQVLGVAAGFGSIADRLEQLPSVLPGARPSQLETALNGENGRQGCAQLVQERVDNPVTTVLDVLEGELASLKINYQTDERVRTFWQSWAACMNDQDLNAANLDVLRDQFTSDANEILSASDFERPNQGGVLGILVPEEERQKIVDDAAEETQSALDELRSREELAASASLECGADPSDTIPRALISVRIEHEEAMLNTSQTKLESLQAEIATVVSDNSDQGS